MIKENKSFDLPILHHLIPRHKCRKLNPKEYSNNALIIAVDNEELIIFKSILSTLNFLHDNDKGIVTLHLCKRVTYQGIKNKEQRSLFDQFEKSKPKAVFSLASNYTVDSKEPIKEPAHFTDILSLSHYCY